MAVYLGLLVLSLLVILVSSEAIYCAENNLKLVIDEDAGADDEMAVFMALIYEKHFCGPEVVGLTMSHGNVNETQAYINTQRMLSIAGRRDVPLYRGATHSIVQDEPSDYFFGLDGLGDTDVGKDFKSIRAMPTEAAIALLHLSHKYEGLLQIVCLGALTNLALAVRLDTGIIDRVAHIYVAAGGHIHGETSSEFNARADVEAYRMVVQAAKPGKVTLLSSTVIREYANITKVWRKEILGSIPTKLMQTQNAFESISWTSDNSTTWNMLDPAVMAIVLNERLIAEEKYSLNDIILCGEQRGIVLNNFMSKDNANVNVVSRVNGIQYQRYLVDVFSQEP